MMLILLFITGSLLSAVLPTGEINFAEKLQETIRLRVPFSMEDLKKAEQKGKRKVYINQLILDMLVVDGEKKKDAITLVYFPYLCAKKEKRDFWGHIVAINLANYMKGQQGLWGDVKYKALGAHEGEAQFKNPRCVLLIPESVNLDGQDVEIIQKNYSVCIVAPLAFYGVFSPAYYCEKPSVLV